MAELDNRLVPSDDLLDASDLELCLAPGELHRDWTGFARAHHPVVRFERHRDVPVALSGLNDCVMHRLFRWSMRHLFDELQDVFVFIEKGLSRRRERLAVRNLTSGETAINTIDRHLDRHFLLHWIPLNWSRDEMTSSVQDTAEPGKMK